MDFHQLVRLRLEEKYALLEVLIDKSRGGMWVEMLATNWDQAVMHKRQGGDGKTPKGLKVVSLFCDNLAGSPSYRTVTWNRALPKLIFYSTEERLPGHDYTVSQTSQSALPS